MTDAEVKEIYLKVDPSGGGGEDDPKWWADAIRTTRAVLEAKSYQKAVAILRRESWGDPEGAANDIRKTKTCPTCEGEGVV